MFNPVSNTMPLNDSAEYVYRKADDMYRSQVFAAHVKNFFARLFGRRRKLMNLNEVIAVETIEGSYYAGQHVVDLDQIRGSEGRSEDFDVEFKPVKENTRDRWLNIARAFLKGETLPPVDLIQVGDVYFIRDGHHRVSVARSMGQRFIDADIILFRTRQPPL